MQGLLERGDSGTIPADETRAPAHDPTKDLAASRSREPTNERRDQSARKVTRQDAARLAAAKEAEQASGEPLDVLVLGVDRRPNSAEGESTRPDTMMKYARYRGTPGADFDRIDHQQKLLATLRRQALR